jgi:iron(III) transport system permease protein
VVGVTDAAVGLRLDSVRTGAPAGGDPPRGRWSRTAAVVLWGYLLLAVAWPLLALLLVALTPALGLAPVPGAWTLTHFAAAWDPLARHAALNSLRLAAGTALVVTVLGALAASWGRRRAGRLVGSASILTFALPGSALGVAVLLAYGRWLRDSLLLILVAYAAKLWALGHRTLAGTLDTLPPDTLRAARASGAGPLTTTRTVTLPLLRPAVGAAALVAFLFAFHELTMSSLLYGPGTRTLAVVILNLHQLGEVQTTAALAVLLTAAVLVASAPLLLLRRRARVTPG